MENIKSDLLRLNTYIDLKREVVGVKFLFTEEEFHISEGKQLKGKMAYCTMIRNAMKGYKIKARLENFACLAAAKALGLMEVTNNDCSGKGRLALGTYKNLCVSRSVSKDMIYCKHEIEGVCIMPLREFNTEPDMVVIVTEPFNMMRLCQGYSYYNGQIKNVKLAGMQAICQECTSYPFENNDINISLLCAGTRMLAQWKESEMGMGIPFHKFSQIVDGVEKTINPIERNKNKQKIENRMEKNNISGRLNIIYDNNYDDGLYGGID